MSSSKMKRTYHSNLTDATQRLDALRKAGFLTAEEPRYSKKFSCWVVYYLPKDGEHEIGHLEHYDKRVAEANKKDEEEQEVKT